MKMDVITTPDGTRYLILDDVKYVREKPAEIAVPPMPPVQYYGETEIVLGCLSADELAKEGIVPSPSWLGNVCSWYIGRTVPRNVLYLNCSGEWGDEIYKFHSEAAARWAATCWVRSKR